MNEYYAVVTKRGEIYPDYIRESAKSAKIIAAHDLNTTWAEMNKYGWKCIKVNIIIAKK